MTERRKIEIFGTGRGVCEAAIAEIRTAACPSCDIEVLDTFRAAGLGQPSA